MNSLTIIIDTYEHQNLKKYLINLEGILNVVIRNEKPLELYIEYNPDLIDVKIIKEKILLFLDPLKISSILSFDKHPTIETLKYDIIIKYIHCEYCLKDIINSLFEIDGIEKAESNFINENYYDEVIISLKYNPNIISIDEIKQIELNL